MGLAIAGAMTGCGKNADDTEATAIQSTEVQSTTEEMSSTIESEVTSEVSSIEITTEPVAQTSSPEEDEIYNYGMISGLGINQDDAKKAAVYLSGISYGRIVSTERLELSNSTYIELKNNEQIVIYFYLLSDGKIKEITDMNLHTLLVISEESNSNQEEPKPNNSADADNSNSSQNQSSNGASDNTAQPSSTQSGGTANSAEANSQPDQSNSQGIYSEEPVYADLGNGCYEDQDLILEKRDGEYGYGWYEVTP